MMVWCWLCVTSLELSCISPSKLQKTNYHYSYQGRLTSAPTRWRWPCPTATASSRAASRGCTSTSACQSGNWASHRWHVISLHLILWCHVMLWQYLVTRWVRCGRVWWTRWWTIWWTWTRSTPGRRQTTGMTWTRWTCPTQASGGIKYLLSLESSPQQYIIICNIIFSGSIEHFEKLFYPKIPCKNCSTCYENFSDEIKWL